MPLLEAALRVVARERRPGAAAGANAATDGSHSVNSPAANTCTKGQ